jgi:N-acetyl-gamma-glutamyl-phosphate reductase
MRAAVLGATGYTGLILLRLLNDHTETDIIYPVSSSKIGEEVSLSDPGLPPTLEVKMEETAGKFIAVDEAAAKKPDVVFAALPHLKSAKILEPFYGNSVIIDLSADFRIKDHTLFKQAYSVNPPKPDLLKHAVYGLSEWYKKQITGADLIANPGCYPTATMLPLLPLLRSNLIGKSIIVNALSGVSGAGKKAKTNLIYSERTENSCAYLPGRSHRHYTEIVSELSSEKPDIDLLFTPHLLPLSRGMAVTTVCDLTQPVSDHEIEKVYIEAYGNSPFISLRGNRIPETRDVRSSNRCDIGWHIEDDRLILFSVIDNLVKGASGQAVQNMNIRFGFDEALGLPLAGSF